MKVTSYYALLHISSIKFKVYFSLFYEGNQLYLTY